MVPYAKNKIKHLFKVEFIRFCVVGGSGFIINFIILVTMRRLFLVPAFESQLVGAEVALFSNFMLHHHWTYKAHKIDKTILQLIVQFHATSWPAIIGSALMVAESEKLLHLSNIFALTLSSGIALLWNFFWSKFIVWRDVTQKEIEEMG